MSDPRDADTVPASDFGPAHNVLDDTQQEVFDETADAWAEWLTLVYFGDDL